MRIAFLGDTLLGGVADETLLRHGYEYAYEHVRAMLGDFDLLVVNHEGPLTAREEPEDKLDTGRKRYWYKGRPAAADALASLGVGVVSLANNHVLDFGIEGLADTIAAFRDAGIAHCGAGLDEPEARRPAVVTVGGVRIAFLSCMQRYDIYVRERLYASKRRGGCSRLRLASLQDDLAALESTVDLRVVLVHWGRNYRAVSARQESLAAGLVEAGADLVIGHHPHIPQRVDLIDGKPVVYSLGNGILGTPGRFHSGRPPYGIAAGVSLATDGTPTSIELQLIAVDNQEVRFAPVAAVGTAASAYLRSLVAHDGGWREDGRGVQRELDAHCASSAVA
jgi:poly-gamma-glutamate capsule biosynthesis protein CapA/YwtB (metallophosphatase superfamily)